MSNRAILIKGEQPSVRLGEIGPTEKKEKSPHALAHTASHGRSHKKMDKNSSRAQLMGSAWPYMWELGSLNKKKNLRKALKNNQKSQIIEFECDFLAQRIY